MSEKNWTPSDIDASEQADSAGAAKRRGRIPKSEWAAIRDRNKKGETLSAIARDYGCTASAIHYIIQKDDNAQEAEAPKPAPTAQVQAPVMPQRPVQESERPKLFEEQPARRDVLSMPNSGRLTITPPDRAASPTTPTTQAPVQATPERRTPPAPPVSSAAPVRTPQMPMPERTASSVAEDASVEERMSDAFRSCLETYQNWKKAPGSEATQKLSDAVHDLRKVLARIEIQIAASRRDEQVARPIPVPLHRASHRNNQEN